VLCHNLIGNRHGLRGMSNLSRPLTMWTSSTEPPEYNAGRMPGEVTGRVLSQKMLILWRGKRPSNHASNGFADPAHRRLVTAGNLHSRGSRLHHDH
jgi:hypothetical protein